MRNFIKYIILLINELIITQLHKRNKKRFLSGEIHPIVGYSTDYIGIVTTVAGRYEQYTLENLFQLFCQNNRKSITALDIGANIGNHSMFFSEHFKHVLAFEPNPLNYELLQINIRGKSNISAFNFGLSNKNERVKFRWHPCNLAGGHVAKYTENQQFLESMMTKENAPIIKDNSFELKRFDDCDFPKSSIDNVSLIKIDVEKHEYSVLQGMVNFFSHNSPIIAFEQHPTEINNGSSEVLEFLRSNGYSKFYEINNLPIGRPYKRIEKLSNKRYLMIAALP
mgnify:CR=1 FL=1